VNAFDRRVKRFRKHVLSFEESSTSSRILVISKLNYNNLIFKEIMVLNALYVCMTHSRFVENHPIWIVEDGPLISDVVLSQDIRARSGLNTHFKHIKITTMFMVRIV
jgi:hypothetical protein